MCMTTYIYTWKLIFYTKVYIMFMIIFQAARSYFIKYMHNKIICSINPINVAFRLYKINCIYVDIKLINTCILKYECGIHFIVISHYICADGFIL